MISLWVILYCYFSVYWSKTGHKRKIRLLALQYCLYISWSYKDIHFTSRKCCICPNISDYAEFCAFSRNDVFWVVRYMSKCLLEFCGSIVKPQVSSLVCDWFYSYMTKNNDTAWPKVKSPSVERGHNHFTQRPTTILIFWLMNRNFLW